MIAPLARLLAAALFLASALSAQAGPIINSYVYAAPAQSFTFVGSAVSALDTIDISSTGRQSGDLGILLDVSVNSSGSPTDTIPSGHSNLRTDTQTLGSNGMRASMRYKILTGSEGSLTGQSGTSWVNKVYLVFRPSIAISTVTLNNASFEATNADPANKTTSAGSGAPPVIVIGQMGVITGFVISPRSTTPAMTEVVGAATNHYGLYKLYNSSPADQTTFDMDDEGSHNVLQLGYLTF